MRVGPGLPVVVTFGLQQGSRTQAWCYDGAVVSSVGGASNGPSSGSSSATVAGLSFGSWGYSGKARVGRGADSSADMTGGTACEASTWKSNSAVECKLSAGVGGGVNSDGAQFGKVVSKVPVNRLTDALDRLIGLYRQQRVAEESLGAFYRRIGPAAATDVLQDLATVVPDELTPADYIDLGETEAFTPEVMDGECAS